MADPVRSAEGGPVPPLDPIGDEARFMDRGEPGNLLDQRDRFDEQGEDIRQYTGEPVETDQGWVIPVQQNGAGADNIAGRGEFGDRGAVGRVHDVDPDHDNPGDDDPDDDDPGDDVDGVGPV